jgi:hypothetical protein
MFNLLKHTPVEPTLVVVVLATGQDPVPLPLLQHFDTFAEKELRNLLSAVVSGRAHGHKWS